MNIFSTHTPMLSWKMQILFHISSPSSQIWKIPQDKGGSFWKECFEYPHPYVILKNAVVTPYPLSK